MNSAYIGKLMELAEKDVNVIHLLADSGTGFDEIFKANFPNQILNFGIGEENMVAAAAGMATVGKIPFVFTSGAFLAYRSMEFIRDDICFQNLNVKLVGMGSGLSWSSLGPTHHTTEDISVLRAIPNLLIFSPATPKQVMACVQTAYEYSGPVYIKIGMNHEKEYFAEDYCLDVGKSDCIKEGNDLLIITTGSILSEVMGACDFLEKDDIHAKVVNLSTIKPINKESIFELSADFEKIFVVEEHNIYGGLAGIIAELFCYEGFFRKIIPIGLKDVFAEGYGTLASVRKKNGLDANGIYFQIRKSY